MSSIVREAEVRFLATLEIVRRELAHLARTKARLVAMLAAWAGYAWFQKTRKGLADVL